MSDESTTAEGPSAPPSPPVRTDDGPALPLDARVVSLWRLTSAVTTVVFTVAVLVPLVVLGWPLWPAAIVFLLGVAEGAYLPAARYRHWRWRVGEVEVRLERGSVWRRVSVVLHSRIQHVDTRQGPLQRMFGLASVVIFTAGSVGAMVEIPGLDAKQAEALRDRLATLSGQEDAV